MPTDPIRFLRTCGVTIVATTIIIACLNLFIDPYLVFGSPRLQGLNSRKSGVRTQQHLIKAYDVFRSHPDTLILGSSGMAVGVYARSREWPITEQPVYNMAFVGATVFTARRYLQHVLSVQPLKFVVLGLDFRDLLSSVASTNAAYESRLKVNQDGTINSKVARQRIYDLAFSALSMDAARDSFETLVNNVSDDSADIQSGDIDAFDFRSKISQVGSYPLFVLADLTYAQLYHDSKVNLKTTDEIQNIILLCQHSGVSLTLVLEPAHADELELAYISGKWPAIESWKRRLTQMAAATAQDSTSRVELWDFLEYDSYSTETVPYSRVKLRWFLTLSHFNPTLGDIVIRRISGLGDPSFGVKLTPDIINRRLEQVREEQMLYHSRQTQDVARIRKIYQVANGMGSTSTSVSGAVVANLGK